MIPFAAAASNRRQVPGPPPVVDESFGDPLDAADVFQMGHSLTGFVMPDMMAKMAIAAGRTSTWAAKIGAGANLATHYVSPSGGQVWPEDIEQNVLTYLETISHDTFVMTEAVPVEDHVADLVSSHSRLRATQFFDIVTGTNPSTQCYLYQHWHYFDPTPDATWAAKIATDRAQWQLIANYVNANRANPSTPDLLIIPGGEAMIAFYEAGDVAGLTIADLFSDDIHPNNLGFYYIACVMYASIYRRSPVGLTQSIIDRFETPYSSMPTEEQAAAMQALALSVVRPWFQAGGLGA